MDTITHLRHRNALLLMKERGDGPSRFAERLSSIKYMQKQQASHIVGERPIKGIGHDVARRIEQAYGKPTGWLDQDHTNHSAFDPEVVEISALTGEHAGSEAALTLRVRKDWVRRNLSATAFEHLSLATMHGDAMAFPDGSLLIIDRGINTVSADGVYLLSHGATQLVRRVQRRLEGGFVILADNKDYLPSTVEDLHKAGTLVLGRVLLVWSGHKL